MKACFKCKVEKPIEEFYAHPQMPDGHLNKCKECTKLDVRLQRRTRLEYYRAYDRQRFYSNPERRRQHAENGKRYRERHPDRRKAQCALSNALRDGRIARKPCAVCGNQNVEGHHFDYTKPLDVIWLCPEHHNALHHPTP